MKKKVWFTLLLAVSLIFISACGGGGASDQVSSDSNEEGNENQTEEVTGNVTPVDTLTLTTVGGSAGGFWSMLGEGIGSLIGEEVPNLQYSYETGSGVGNIVNVSRGEVPLGIAFNFEVMAGLNGQEPFNEPLDEVTALLSLYDNSPVQVVISKRFAEQHGITSLADIKEKEVPLRAAVNQRGNLSETVNRTIFEAYGFTYEDIESWGGSIFYEPYRPGSELMRNNRADLVGVPVFAPDSAFQELSTSTDIMLLELDANAQQVLAEKMGLAPGLIEAGTYDWQEEDVSTSFASAFLLVDSEMSVEEAYTITRAIVENIEKYRALHQNVSEITPEQMANVAPATLHPGAELYFQEIGVLD
ncbi:TAXI family TRAP transporter solute-binding subunit [Halalkalibacterium ligniniphilum]|uniref:TAXI family TRAP transporter solute-binding subunit n=1 Tax=Halalkalibacterium ligniniphilum TaxID=1134413 RepID=UPI00034D0DD2|nr:TAXI family TRAP transporter solute-binding subunit [Halalkalibacterium ligniniphilum]